MAKIAFALAELHDRGIIHRDLKPANVMLRPNGEPVLMDFGLARSQDSRTSSKGSVGTPAYMSPEQVNAEKTLTPATDVYSLGVMLFEMTTGKVPFDGAPLVVVCANIVMGRIPPAKVEPAT